MAPSYLFACARRPGGRRARRTALLALVLAAGALGACDSDGSRLVTVGNAPAITRLDVPATISPGSAMVIVAEALGRRGVSSINVQLSGAYRAEFVTPFNAVTDTARATHTVTIPDTVSGLTIVVKAFALGPDGRESRVEERTVNVLGLTGTDGASAAAGEAAPYPAADAVPLLAWPPGRASPERPRVARRIAART